MCVMFNHMFDVAFTVDTKKENHEDVTLPEFLNALEKRIQYLKTNPEEAMEAFGYSDTYEYDA